MSLKIGKGFFYTIFIIMLFLSIPNKDYNKNFYSNYLYPLDKLIFIYHKYKDDIFNNSNIRTKFK